MQWMLWNGSEENENVRSECEEDKGTHWKWRQWYWLIKVDRIWYALCIKCLKLIVIFFFCRHFIFGGLSYLDKYIFPWLMCFLVGFLRLGSSCIQVNTVNKIKYNFDFTNVKRCKCMHVHSVEQKSIGLIFRTSRSGSDVRYSAIIIRVVLLSPYLRIRGVSVSSIHYNHVYINRRQQYICFIWN